MKAIAISLFLLLASTVHSQEAPSANIRQNEQKTSEYIVEFQNFPKNHDIIVSQCRTLQNDSTSFLPVGKINILDDNSIIINGKTKADHYKINASGYALGEPVKYRYSLANGTLIAEAEYTPRPLRFPSKQETFTMEARLTTLEPTTYFLKFQGLKEGESVLYSSISGNEVIEDPYVYYSKNLFAYMPGILGKRGGYALVRFKRNSGDYVIAKLPWGSAILDQMSLGIHQ